MEENKVMENQVEAVEVETVPVAVADDVPEDILVPRDSVDTKEVSPIAGVALGAGIIIGGIALVKGVKAGVKAGRKAKQKIGEKLDDLTLRKAEKILAKRGCCDTDTSEDISEEMDSTESEE